MLFIDSQGLVCAGRITVRRFTNIERQTLDKINGIVVHQTGGSTAQSTFNSYGHHGANGAHFLIDKDGKIYQTASLFKTTNHVGKVRSRCYMEKTCTAAELARVGLLLNQYSALHNLEKRKPYPERYPTNLDSLAIEVVGKPVTGQGEKAIYETVNDAQNASLRWLINELLNTLNLSKSSIFKHPEISYKLKSEASTAEW